MPLPSYIVCSESVSEDRVTSQISLFNIVDRVQFAKLPPGVIAVGGINFAITAAWRREDGDTGREFEFESGVFTPEEFRYVLGNGTLVFSAQNVRIVSRVFGSVPATKSGIMRAFSRIRIKDDPEATWHTQQYLIDVEEGNAITDPGAGLAPTPATDQP